MGVTFTPQQQQVIDLRDCNILVSAAAGSGKTAVLTQRIVEMVSDEEHPVDIDRLLVVTFTGAAAAQMRERIGLGLGEKLSLHPESEHLQRQATLLHNAQITTIDSFCLFLVKNHFNEIGLDPSFRVADEREVGLLRQEVLEELFEDAFEKGGEPFRRAVEILCPRGKEKTLEEDILSLSRYAASFPWPQEWLEQRKADYRVATLEELCETPLWRYLKRCMAGMISGCLEKLETALGIAQEPDGPYMYAELLEKERESLEALTELQDPEAFFSGLGSIAFDRLPGKKDDSVNPLKRELARSCREDVKKTVSELQEQFTCASPEKLLQQSRSCEEPAAVLIDLVLEFDRRLREKKQDRRIIDFSDMEHFALQILLEKEGENVYPSRVAQQYREYYQEILIDEYQDSNLVQEYLLSALTGEEDGRYNRFMVGDVKQSIYRFRLARPELFLEKYDTYQEEGKRRRIDLSRNFRSRETVIRTVNSVFLRMMSREIGGIEYDERAALYAGASYPENEGMESEFLMVEKPEKGADLEDRRAEALAVAARIKELVQRTKVTDRETGTLRPAHYRDIVILLRSLSGWGEDFREVLEEQGVPVYVTSKSGYFDASEVQDLLNFLRIVDNPLQDIPLYGVLHSCFGGFTQEEIACLRAECREGRLYDALRSSGQERAQTFCRRLEHYRELAQYLTVRSLLTRITEDFDYLNHVTALPRGAKRRANVEMLFVKASDFEKTSYFGLFHFLRYIQQLEKYEEDYGEADTLEENADVVRIMSIHKSKGLEFPIVFVSALAKSFNRRDLGQPVIMDMDLGLGMDYVDPTKRFRCKTLRKNAVAKKLREDALAEELRLFYVALTRPMEKLILTAVVSGAEKILKEDALGEQEHLTFLDFIKASSYLDFLSPILKKTDLVCKEISLQSLMGSTLKEQVEMTRDRGQLELAHELADREELARLQERFAFQYPHAALEGLYTKTTVSELKIAAMCQRDEAAYHAFEEKEADEYVPAFRRQQEEVTGTVRGNAYHRAMELLDFDRVLQPQMETPPGTYEEYGAGLKEEPLKEAVEAFLQEQTQNLRLPEEYLGAIRPQRICRFLGSELGYRMWKAFREGRLYREQPFVLAIPATRLKEEFPEEEQVLVQGIIDVYFVEEGEIVLLDYKTDVIPDMHALQERYSAQLDYYQEALERLTAMPVKEKILYSFHLGNSSAIV